MARVTFSKLLSYKLMGNHFLCTGVSLRSSSGGYMACYLESYESTTGGKAAVSSVCRK